MMTSTPRLHINEVGRPKRTVEVTGTTTIGRASDSDIVLDDAIVSHCHALLLTRPEHVVLIDLDSSAGTFVNGVPVPPDEAVQFTNGDVITLGLVVLRYAALPAPGASSAN